MHQVHTTVQLSNATKCSTSFHTRHVFECVTHCSVLMYCSCELCAMAAFSAAIKKYIEANIKGLDFQQHQLRAALKRRVSGVRQADSGQDELPTEKANLVKGKKTAAKPAAAATKAAKATKAKATPVKKVSSLHSKF